MIVKTVKKKEWLILVFDDVSVHYKFIRQDHKNTNKSCNQNEVLLVAFINWNFDYFFVLFFAFYPSTSSLPESLNVFSVKKIILFMVIENVKTRCIKQLSEPWFQQCFCHTNPHSRTAKCVTLWRALSLSSSIKRISTSTHRNKVLNSFIVFYPLHFQSVISQQVFIYFVLQLNLF
jgi:hypothetical protein